MTTQPDPLPNSQAAVEARLRAGETAAAIAADLEADVETDADGIQLVVLPGWWADWERTTALRYPDADSAAEAAAEYVAGGDWGDDDSTRWILVDCWRAAVGIDEDGDIVTARVDETAETVTLDPPAPDCEDGEEHDWACDHAVVGGCEENPGVWGSGGGVRMVRHCRLCGCGQHTDTWAQDPATGEQALTSVRYVPGEFAAAEGGAR